MNRAGAERGNFSAAGPWKFVACAFFDGQVAEGQNPTIQYATRILIATITVETFDTILLHLSNMSATRCFKKEKSSGANFASTIRHAILHDTFRIKLDIQGV